MNMIMYCNPPSQPGKSSRTSEEARVTFGSVLRMYKAKCTLILSKNREHSANCCWC